MHCIDHKLCRVRGRVKAREQAAAAHVRGGLFAGL